ncbi:arginine N-succinyltransferase [Arhodomonas sp. SL1]|uniref:arginine N-succinyltransferase n=1 Tax=Arhodomonas sp. SL1 TaxID=3425691 RepID=UPI003F884CF6
MHVIRPVRETDLDALEELVSGTGVGMTSLPRERGSLARRIHTSLATFEGGPQQLRDGERGVLFVLEDRDNAAVVGTTGVQTGVGLGEPFYNYRVSTIVHASRELGVHRIIPTLYINNDYTGCTEIGSLFLHADHRGGGLGRLASKARFLLLAGHAEHFPGKVIAEMRGVSDERGRSPFWDGVGRHFFSMPFRRADYLSGTRGKSFIAELMPRNPIYVPLLPRSAQEVIGEVHPQTRAALRLLRAEGFHYEGYVDIFDGGPAVEARIEAIDAVRRSRLLTAVAGTPAADAPRCIVANTGWSGFRCVLTPVTPDGGRAVLSAAAIDALELDAGARVRAVPASVDERGPDWFPGEVSE